MFYVISKLFFGFARPLHFLLLIMLIGLILQATPVRHFGRWLGGFGLVCLLAISFGPLSPLIERPLENRFPRPDVLDPAPDGIIILGGSLNPELGASRPNYYSLDDAGERLIEVPRLSRLYPNARIIYTGGPAETSSGALNEAQSARKLLVDLGVPTDRITLEENSMTTWENAVMTKELINPAPNSHWLLVTSAFHMPRSVGTFRKAGWPGIIAYPTDYRLPDPKYHIPYRLAAIENLDLIDTAAKEWFGLIGYWLGNRSSALFPAPWAAETLVSERMIEQRLARR